jgi:hypothetical protein
VFALAVWFPIEERAARDMDISMENSIEDSETPIAHGTHNSAHARKEV